VNRTDGLERSGRPTWAGFAGWAVLGVIAGFSAVSFPTALIVPLVVGVVLVNVRPNARRSWLGVLTGMGGVALFVAYVQRRGPGTVCWHTARAAGCDDYLDPIPWLVVGAGLVVAGFVGHVRRIRASRSVPA
jgi:predicted ABC-type sugar transport system permease subunit